MSLRLMCLIATATVVLGVCTPARALNPQPEPPGRHPKMNKMPAGTKVNPANPKTDGDKVKSRTLPPGPCKGGTQSKC